MALLRTLFWCLLVGTICALGIGVHPARSQPPALRQQGQEAPAFPQEPPGGKKTASAPRTAPAEPPAPVAAYALFLLASLIILFLVCLPARKI